MLIALVHVDHLQRVVDCISRKNSTEVRCLRRQLREEGKEGRKGGRKEAGREERKEGRKEGKNEIQTASSSRKLDSCRHAVCPCLGTGVRAASLLLTHGGSNEQCKERRLLPTPL